MNLWIENAVLLSSKSKDCKDNQFEVIEIAYEIYLDENDKTGERLTVEDISYFLSNCDISLEELKIMGKDERRELMYKFFEQ